MILLFVIHTILNIFEDSMATLTNVHMRFPMNTFTVREPLGENNSN